MRFRVSLRPEADSIKLPYNYAYALSAAIYSFLERSQPKFSRFLHNEGYLHYDKSFKLFTFSPLFAARRKAVAEGLVLKDRIDWFISSPKEEFLINLANGILSQGFLLIDKHKLLVDSVEVLSPPAFTGKTSFKTLSPIVISTGELTDNGSFIKKYLSPFDSRFYRIMEENLRRKYQACYGKEPPGDGITVEFDQEFISKRRISKLIDFKGIKIRGWQAPFTAQGNLELIRLGYEAGFGENNSAGFGMVEVTKSSD